MVSETESDEIASPPHYCEGRAYEPKIKDLLKARQYLDFEIEALKKEGKI